MARPRETDSHSVFIGTQPVAPSTSLRPGDSEMMLAEDRLRPANIQAKDTIPASLAAGRWRD